jgi:ankyrin repeat protein
MLRRCFNAILEEVFEYLDVGDWYSTMLTCKLWLEKGRRVFDPSKCLMKSLIRACERHMYESVRHTLRDPRVLNSSSFPWYGAKALQVSCMHGYTDLVRLLLSHADPSNDKNLSLCYAVQFGHADIVELLLSDQRIDPSINQNTLKFACRFGYDRVVQLLLDDGRTDPRVEYHSPVYIAIKRGWTNIVTMLLNDPRIEIEKHGNFFIIETIENDRIDMMEMILTNQRFAPNVELLFRIACNSAKSDAILLLLNHPKLNIDSSLYHAIDNLIIRGQDQHIVSVLRHPKIPKCPGFLLTAIRMDRVPIVRIMINELGYIPSTDVISYSLCQGYIDLTIELLKHPHIDPSMNDNHFLCLAAYLGNVQVVRSLLQDRRIDPSARDNEPIIIASKYGHVNVVKELLKDPRVDPSARSNSAVIAASKNEHTSVIEELLKDHRVDQDNYAYKFASIYRYADVISTLKRDSRVKRKIRQSSSRKKSSKRIKYA